MNQTELKLSVSPEKGDVSALLCRPDRAIALLVLGHGAGANMHHPHMCSLAAALYQRNVATLRYNFPFLEDGRKGRDSRSITYRTIRTAVAKGKQIAGGIPLLAGGHSFGGRMTSMAQVDSPLVGIRGLVFFSFPLHPPGKPGVERAEHLASIRYPMLCISGTRDTLASQVLLSAVVAKLGSLCKLHYLETADHSFKILKRQRPAGEDVYAEAAGVVSEWINQL